jgi:hypothetical protein
MKHSWKIKSQRKAQEGHLEEGKAARPTKDMKSGKSSQNGKEELRKTQSQNKTSNKSSNSKTPPDTLNANSPS